MGKLFGTDGIRGVANQELSGELAYQIGRAGAYFLCQNYLSEKKPVLLIGKDTRVSGDMLEAALAAGMMSVGVDVIKLGIIPTPGVAYLSNKLEVQGGVMISASHNPIADNGIKFFTQDGFKLSDAMEEEIEDLIFNRYQEIATPTHGDIGQMEVQEKLVQDYIDYLLQTIELDLKGLKIVLDCANGAAYQVSPEVFRRLGAELKVLNNHPDGNKINVACGSTHPEIIQEEVRRTGADLGIAHDGDADRVIMVDEKGQVVDGDQIMAIWALDLLKQNKLKGKTLVTTAYSNLGLKELLENNGGKLVTAANGDRYVLEKMQDKGFNLGGEKSGHIIFLDYNHTGDGILTALQISAIVKRTGQKLSKLAGVMQPWPQRLSNVRVKAKEAWMENARIREEIKAAEKELGDTGRVLVRASGTEPVIRVMLEGKDAAQLVDLEERLTKVIFEELN